MTRRRLDPLSLLGGLFFAVVGIVALAIGPDSVGRSAWLWPVLFCVLGAGFLAAAATRGGRRHDDGHDAIADETTFL